MSQVREGLVQHGRPSCIKAVGRSFPTLAYSVPNHRGNKRPLVSFTSYMVEEAKGQFILLPFTLYANGKSALLKPGY